MSYEIVYGAIAVRENENSDRYLVLLIAGSNNCFDVLPDGRERRERSWTYNFLTEPVGRYGFFSQEETMKGIDAFYESVCENVISRYEEEKESEKDSEFRVYEEFDGMTRSEMRRYIYDHFGYYASLAFYGSNALFQLSVAKSTTPL